MIRLIIQKLYFTAGNGREAINVVSDNGKRFMAHELVTKLKAKGHYNILNEMRSFVRDDDRFKGQKHRVFEPSFDWKECYTDKFLEQKLSYMHLNPCKGAWRLVTNPEDYLHSSAKFYICYQQGNLSGVELWRP